MATYYTNSSNQRDDTPMIYLPGSCPDGPIHPGNMMMYMNSGSYSDSLADNSQQQSHCMEIQSVVGPETTHHQQEILSSIGGPRTAEHDFNAWRDGRNEMLVMHSIGGPSSVLHAGQNLQGQGLSLSLGTQIASAIHMPSSPFRNPTSAFPPFFNHIPSPMSECGGRTSSSRDEQSRNVDYLPPGFAATNQDSNRGDMAPYGMTNVARSIPNSKYLKAAQQLLDEVVNVRKAMKQPDKEMNQNTHENAAKKSESGSKNDPSNPQVSSNNSATELTHAERQELQNKLTKLMSMLEEVDRRYRQYFHQMQIVVSSFDVIAGSGAAKPYTTLALQTISRHFRCIRDAIADQIRATRKNLGEQETSENGNAVGIPRLRYVDQQLRQQRALQQLGMMQQHAWRPQRGLPESSVSILRAWLFEHFLHPYPKDSDKIMLARQTGLSRSQVSNWFINARVRLWKPMVEEMYKEETGDPEMMDSNSSSDNVAKGTKGGTRSSEDRGEDIQQSASSSVTERCNAVQLMESRSNHIPEMEMAGSTTEDECNLIPDRFMAAYQLSDMGRFGSGSGVSLTLGLQHCEGVGMLTSGAPQHSFVSMRGDDIYSAATSSVGGEPSELECINPVNRRQQQQQRFNSSHLLHNFVS